MPVETPGGHSFQLRRDGVALTGIRQVRGLTMELDVIETVERGPDGSRVVKRVPGGWRPGEVTVTRALTKDDAFEAWLEASHPGGRPGDRAPVSVDVLDREGARVRRYELVDAWPRSLTVVLPDAGSRTVVTEELIISYGRLNID